MTVLDKGIARDTSLKKKGFFRSPIYFLLFFSCQVRAHCFNCLFLVRALCLYRYLVAFFST